MVPSLSFSSRLTYSVAGWKTTPHYGAVLATTPDPPYVAVIFSAVLGTDATGYADAVARMRALAAQQPGFLGIDTAGGEDGQVEITVSYWASEADAAGWKANAEHVVVQQVGRERWYESYRVRVARVDRAYDRIRTAE